MSFFDNSQIFSFIGELYLNVHRKATESCEEGNIGTLCEAIVAYII